MIFTSMFHVRQSFPAFLAYHTQQSDPGWPTTTISINSLEEQGLTRWRGMVAGFVSRAGNTHPIVLPKAACERRLPVKLSVDEHGNNLPLD
jgi:hypothetical protein